MRQSELAGTFAVLSEAFWDTMLGGLREATTRSLYRQGTGLERLFSEKLGTDALAAVKTRMSADLPLLASEPSRFIYKFMRAFAEETATCKRRLMENPPEALRGYDMEANIKDTERLFEVIMVSTFQCELAFWKAMDEKRFEDARVILGAIQRMRTNAEMPMRMELVNWRLEVSARLGDLEMFVDAFAEIPDANQIVDPDGVASLVRLLLHSRGCNRVLAAPTKEGVKQAACHPQGQAAFITEHLEIFLKSLVLQVVGGLVANPKISAVGFRTLVTKAIADSRKSFLATSKYIADLKVPNV